MFGIDFHSLPVALNGLMFAVGAVIVWIAGTRLAVYADALAERTGIGRAFLGLVLLAGVTELPECVTSLTAIAAGNAPLAVNNLFGGIVMQTAILAIADLLLGKGSLSFFTPKPELLLQGVLLVLLLGLVLAGITSKIELEVAGVGLWTALVFGLYLLSIWLVGHFQAGKHWRPVDLPDSMMSEPATPRASSPSSMTMGQIGRALTIVSIVILIVGTLLVATGEAIADQTDLGYSFTGATLLATTTSLPELSTTLGAVRLRAYSMAFANIFGSNAIMVALLFLTDLFHREGAILSTVDASATFAAAMGIVVTAIYLVGLIMRRHRIVFRMGIDSLLVLIAYASTTIGLYLLRHG